MRFFTLKLLLLSLLFAGEALGRKTSAVDFNSDIRIILSDHCFACHGPDEEDRKADLRLDTREGALADLGGYAAIKPGDPDASELIVRISLARDDDDLMPPLESHKELSVDEIELLTRWIAEGAEYAEAWTYVAPRKHKVPEISQADWPVNWVDSFVLEKLEQEGLLPAPEADRATLLRRLYFDLTGLPPSPEAVQAFVDDKTDFEVLWAAKIEELLVSPRFGERMAMYWLDLVRFADTVGYHGDQDHNISPYRDYVIRAFNRNLPFDQFTREQLAGDLLPDSGKWQKVASGYNRLLQTSHEGGIQKKEYNSIYAADRVRNVSAVWMGATVGCAQCHDHKFDPYTSKDFYAMAAFFADVHDEGYSGNSLPTHRPPEMTFYTDQDEIALDNVVAEIDALIGRDLDVRLAELTADKEKLKEQIETAERRRNAAASRAGVVEKERARHMKANDTEKQKKADDKLRLERAEEKKQADQLAVFKADMIALDATIEAAVPEGKRRELARLYANKKQIKSRGVKTMITEAQPPRDIRFLPRGNWQDDTGELMSPAIPVFMGAIEKPEGEIANRLDLAVWLTDAEEGAGGLTARVFANRMWYLFFGTGISRSLGDFGAQGEPPANPELLDNLAVSFYQNDWDTKALARLLLSSRSYRQSSLASDTLRKRDPYNQLLAHQSSYRLPAEMIRDQALAVSGLLVNDLGGESVKPYQPVGYYRHLNFPPRTYKAHQNSRQWRRGVYVHWQRMFLHPMMKAMDAPSREECTAQRPLSNTPTAALVLLNDPTFVEAARVFAARVIREGGETFESRLNRAFQLAVSRSPDDEERQLMESLLQRTRAEYQENPAAVEALLKIGHTSHDGVDALEQAAWTAVTRVLLNLDETITRN